MIDDLLDLTDANILILSEEPQDTIVNLLRSHQYHQVSTANTIATAVESYQQLTPDLVILKQSKNFNITELAENLKKFNNNHLSPIFLINVNTDNIPLVDTEIKDFINTPINEREFLYRLHHLLKDHLSQLEMKSYNQTILSAFEQRNQELKETQIEIIECLGYAAEFRDNETGMHTIRVGLYSRCLAKATGMSDKESESLLFSAPMHDVGKIGIPDKILLKPDRLNAEEWKIMKQHPTIGESILNRSKNKLLQQASIIALNHHEKWDGSGYPRGLSGTDIHLYGRIVAIVDVFDALTMERPYKKAWSIDAAVELINSESGKHFDPTLVDSFNQCLEQILSIKALNSDDLESNNLLSEYIDR